MPKEDFRREVEKELTGRDTEPWQIIYFKLYESQIPVVEKAIETAALMLGSEKSRGYCLEMICADFLAGANLDNDNPLQCTPGNDVECVTAQVGAGANLVLFTTGLGTPTGNPIPPVLKISTNSTLARRMRDIIDIDSGAVFSGEKTLDEIGETLLERLLEVASGEVRTKAELLGQDDFIPWKRCVSL